MGQEQSAARNSAARDYLSGGTEVQLLWAGPSRNG